MLQFNILCERFVFLCLIQQRNLAAIVGIPGRSQWDWFFAVGAMAELDFGAAMKVPPKSLISRLYHPSAIIPTYKHNLSVLLLFSDDL